MAEAGPAPEIIAIGEPLLELNQTEPGEPRYVSGFGGDTSNCVIAASRLGARTGYLTRLGADEFGDAFMRLWEREGVDCSHVIRDPQAFTGIYFVTHGAQGHSFSYYRAGSAASRLLPEEIPSDYLSQARIVHASGISQAISTSACDAVFLAMGIARRAGVLVSYDTNLRSRLWPLARARAVIHEAASRCDILLPGLDDARALTGLDEPDEVARFYLDLGAPIVALTLGAEGCLIATPERSERLASHRVQAVDATGAGDTFDGAFLTEYLRTGDAFRAGRFANAAAALATTGFGAVAPLPRRPECEALLQATS